MKVDVQSLSCVHVCQKEASGLKMRARVSAVPVRNERTLPRSLDYASSLGLRLAR